MTDGFTAGASRAVDDFLKAVYSLQQSKERVSTNELAELLAVKAPTVTDMARRMVDAGLIDYRKYYGVRLTPEGEEIALKIIRRHRLIELYLMEELGYEIQEVHQEAEKLEHAVSDRFISAIAHKLGDPTVDPHGDPIPDAEGVMANRNLRPLTDMGLNEPAVILRFKSTNADMLQHILDRGFRLNMTVTITAQDPFNGPVTVNANGRSCVIGHNVASAILVDPL